MTSVTVAHIVYIVETKNKHGGISTLPVPGVSRHIPAPRHTEPDDQRERIRNVFPYQI